MGSKMRLLKKAAFYGKKHVTQELDYVLQRGVSTPDRVEIRLTRRCNAECTMCDYWKTDPRVAKREVPIARWIEVLEEMHAWMGSFFLTLTGGEPFAKKGITELMKRAVQLDIPITLQSNGIVFKSEKMLKKFYETGTRSITFSVDGRDPEVHNRYRGYPGLFEIIENAIKRIKRDKPEVAITLTSIVMRETIGTLVDYVHWARDIGVDRIQFQAIAPVFGRAGTKHEDDENQDLFIHDTDLVDRTVDQLVELKESWADMMIGNSVSNLIGLKSYFRDPNVTQVAQEKNRCMLGQTNLIFDEFGDMAFCHRKNKFGNIAEGKIRDIWQGHRANHERGEVKHCQLPCISLCFRSYTLPEKIGMFYKFAKVGKL